MERETRETVALDALMWGITNAEEELRARRARKASVRYKLNLLQDLLLENVSNVTHVIKMLFPPPSE
jgi:hypothetical protein